MAKGVVMPARSSASQIPGRTPSSRKVVVSVSSLSKRFSRQTEGIGAADLIEKSG